jgi:TPR repeat protein
MPVWITGSLSLTISGFSLAMMCWSVRRFLPLAVLLLFFAGGSSLAAAAELDDALLAVEKNQYETAFGIFKKLAEAGDSEAQYNLAMLYRAGKGVTKNPEQGAQWFRRAADQGLAEAQFQLGYCYDKGEGVGQNDQYAFVWYKKAAEQGHAKAQINLGVMYANGLGTERDLQLAYVWFNLAAAQGSAIAYQNKQILAEAFSPEQLEALRGITREFFQKYVEPYAEPMQLRSRFPPPPLNGKPEPKAPQGDEGKDKAPHSHQQ